MNYPYRNLLGLGFASGLPFSLVNTTLQAWMADAGINPAAIGLFTLVCLPHSLKFFWAPLLDRYRLPFLGRRTGWMAAAQLCLCGLIVWLGAQSPAQALGRMAWLAVAVMLAATIFDINYAGLRTDSLQPSEYADGSAASVMGYRVAILTSGALAMILSGFIGWRATYWLMAALLGACLIFTVRAREPGGASVVPRTLREAFLPPFRELAARRHAGRLALFILIYALGNCMEMTMVPVFAIQGAGFTVTEVGVVFKLMGSAALIAGVAVSAAILRRLGMMRTFILVSALQMLLHLLLFALAVKGHNYPLFVAAVLLDNLAISFTSTLWSTWMMTLCDVRYPGTQYALISAMAGSTRILSGPLSGYLAAHLGWSDYFLCNCLFDAPGLYLLFVIREHLRPAAPAPAP